MDRRHTHTHIHTQIYMFGGEKVSKCTLSLGMFSITLYVQLKDDVIFQQGALLGNIVFIALFYRLLF